MGVVYIYLVVDFGYLTIFVGNLIIIRGDYSAKQKYAKK